MESATIASVTELFGKLRTPETYRLVVVTEVADKLFGEKFVAASVVKKPLVEVMLAPLADPKDKPVALKFVEVALVKMPAAGVVRPIDEPFIGVLVTVPPLIVRPSTATASVIELLGRFTTPEIYKFVEVTFVAKMLVEVTIVPDAEVKLSGPDNDPPVSKR